MNMNLEYKYCGMETHKNNDDLKGMTLLFDKTNRGIV